MTACTFGSVTIPLAGQYTIKEPVVISTETNVFGEIINGVQYINKNIQIAETTEFSVSFDYTSVLVSDTVIGALMNLVGTQQTLTMGDGRVFPYMKLNPITGPKEIGKGVYKYTLSFSMQTA